MGLCEEGEECCAGSCVPLGCDDGNPCTDDACVATGCEHTPNEADCDDGVFCNGTDTCAGGTCSVNAGDPCLGDTICDEAMSTCVGCLDDADCPVEQLGPWSTCSYSSTCAISGTRTRTRTQYACGAGGVCTSSMSTVNGTCSRTRGTDVSCGANFETCNGSGLCRCQGGPLCGATQSCGLSGCGTTPTFTNDGPACIDLGQTFGPVFGFTMTGPPGAYYEKWDEQVSCFPTVLRCNTGYLDGDGRAQEMLQIQADPVSCGDSILGRWESWAVIDGIRVPLTNETVTYRRSGCGGESTCTEANSFCPATRLPNLACGG